MLRLTLMLMQRDRNNTVTSKKKTLPVLIASSPEAQEGVATFQQELGVQPVRTFRNEDLTGIKKHLSESDVQHFRAVIALKEALKKRTDAIALENALDLLRKAYELRQAEPQFGASYTKEAAQGFAKLIGLPPQEALKHLQFLRAGPRASEDPGWLLSYELSTALWDARFVLWWTNQTFRPAVWCPNMKTAFYARALLDVVGGKGIRICPHCGELFIQDRPDQDYCTVVHREAHRVARWRLQQKKKKTGKKEKNVARKAR
jgi:hypothetical protein